MLRFCAIFLVLIVAVSLVASSRPVAVYVHEHLTRGIATLAARILSCFGPAAVSGHELSFQSFGGSVEGACDGLQPTYVYLCAVLAFPSRWRDKAWGFLLGIPAIFLINLIRVVTLAVCGAYWPESFESVHLYGWQALVIVLTMAVWLLWAEGFVRHARRTAS